MDLSLSFYFVPLISISVFVLVHYCFDDRSFVQFSSVTQSCPTLCDPMNHSTPGLPVHQQLLESTQIHVHLVSDAIQPSHPLSSPSPPALNLSQHQGLFKCSFVVQSKVRKVDFGSFILPSDQIRSDQSLSHVRLFATPWITARQASLSITNSRSSLKLTSIKSVMPSSHLILCRPLLLLPPNPSQHQGLFQWVNCSHDVAKVLEFQLQHQSFQWTSRTDLL